MPWSPGCCGGKHGKANMTIEEQVEYAANATNTKVILEFVTGAMRNYRRDICAECEFKGVHKCKKNGRLLLLLIPLKHAKCPIRKWLSC